MAELEAKLGRFPLTRGMRAAQFIALQYGLALTAAALLALPRLAVGLAPNWDLLIVFPPLAWLAPYLALQAALWQRHQALTRAYGDLVGHLVLMLDAGASSLQAFTTAPAVVREPLRTELRTLVADLKIAPLPSAVSRFAARTGHTDIQFFAENLILQQKVGIGLGDALKQEERHSRNLYQESIRQRIKSGSLTMAAVTAILLANAVMMLAIPFLHQWFDLMAGLR